MEHRWHLKLGRNMTPELTFESHFKFGYDEVPFLPRQNSQQKWWVRYGSCRRAPQSFFEEALETARVIASVADRDIWVLFSGGVDSEVTLRSFVAAKIKVKVAIARFKGDLNIHDISWAVIACEELDVPYYFFDLDLLDFWSSQASYYAEISQCISPQLVVTMWLSDQISGYPVFGGGECLLVKDFSSMAERSVWSLWERENCFVVSLFYCKK